MKKWIGAALKPLGKNKKIWLAIIQISLTFIILGVILYEQRDVLIAFKWQIRFIPLLLAFILFSITLYFGAFIWGYILNTITKKLPYKTHTYNYIISNLSKRLPGTIWYIASRAQLYSEEGIALKVTTLASGLEIAFIALAGILTVLSFSTEIIIRYQLNPIIFVIIFILGFVILQPPFIRWFIKLLTKEELILNYRFILLGLLAYIINWLLGGLLLYEIGNIIYPISQSQIGYMIGSWAFVGTVSILLLFSPTNFGITEIGLSLLLSSIVPFSVAVIIAIISRVLIIIFEIFWAGMFFGMNHFPKETLTQKD